MFNITLYSTNRSDALTRHRLPYCANGAGLFNTGMEIYDVK
jgi:hypothetical protein